MDEQVKRAALVNNIKRSHPHLYTRQELTGQQNRDLRAGKPVEIDLDESRLQSEKPRPPQ